MVFSENCWVCKRPWVFHDDQKAPMLCDSCQGQYTEMLLIEELVAKSYEDEKEDE